jgi:nucleoside-diphosphate-sugar epimerase
VDEHSCTAPSGFNGRALLCAEQQFLAESKNNSIVRFSGIYGPGRNHLIRNIKAGKAVQYEPPYYTNRIHHEDCVGVLFWLAQQRRTGQPVGGIYVASDDMPVPLGDVAMWLAYGLLAGAMPVILANLITLVLATAILWVKLQAMLAASRPYSAAQGAAI